MNYSIAWSGKDFIDHFLSLWSLSFWPQERDISHCFPRPHHDPRLCSLIPTLTTVGMFILGSLISAYMKTHSSHNIFIHQIPCRRDQLYCRAAGVQKNLQIISMEEQFVCIITGNLHGYFKACPHPCHPRTVLMSNLLQHCQEPM